MIPDFWTDTIILESYHCDRTDHLSLWALARIFQEASAHHTDVSHLGYRQLMSEGKAWVLSRMHYEMDRMPRLGDRVQVRTWSRGSDGLFAVRDFLMTDQRGITLCSATTYWVVIDIVARRVCRISDIMATFPVCDDVATRRGQFGKLRLGSFDDAEQMCQSLVLSSAVDHTQHLNNAEYICLMSDYLPDDPITGHGTIDASLSPLQMESPYNGFAFQIDYLVETRPGEMLTMLRRQDSDAVCFQFLNPRGISTVARYFKMQEDK